MESFFLISSPNPLHSYYLKKKKQPSLRVKVFTVIFLFKVIYRNSKATSFSSKAQGILMPTFFLPECFLSCYSLQYSACFLLRFLSKLNSQFQDFSNSLFEDKGNVVVLIFLAFSTIFDMLPHGKLLVKVGRMGISARTVKWIRHWLKRTDRGLCCKGSKAAGRQVLKDHSWN